MSMLRKIYWKEIKDSFRDGRTLFLTVILPVLIMTGMVFFYENIMTDSTEDKTYHLAISENATELEKSIFTPMENIELIETDDTRKLVEEGEVQAAIVFGDNFQENIENEQDTSITIIGNSFSKNSSELMQLVEIALVSFESNIVKERLLAEGMDESKIKPFSLEFEEISEDSGTASMLAFLIPLLLLLAMGIGASPAASDLFAGEKERKTMESLLMTPVSRSTMLIAKWLTITTIGLLIGIMTLIVVSAEIYFFTEELRSVLESIDQVGAVIGISGLVIFVYALFVSSMLMISSIVAKTVKEAQSYMSPIMILGMFPAMFMTMVSAAELKSFHFMIPMMNMFAIIKELFVGIINYQHLLLFIVSNLVIAIVLFIISRVMFLKDKWVIS